MVSSLEEVNWKKTLPINKLFRMQLSPIKTHFIYSGGASGQTEKRLQNIFSLGVGGHMNPNVSMESGEQYLIDELKREFYEEVKLLNGCLIENIEFTGFINDDTIPVGLFHIGLLYNIKVSNREVYINETDKMTAEWVDKSSLAEFYEGMETWTKIIFDFYIK